MYYFLLLLFDRFLQFLFLSDVLSLDWQWLREDVGYDSLRFDFSKGYGGHFVKKYLEAAGPEFSVGEFWDTCTYEGSGLAYNQVRSVSETCCYWFTHVHLRSLRPGLQPGPQHV
jgi:hypothetical protein